MVPRTGGHTGVRTQKKMPGCLAMVSIQSQSRKHSLGKLSPSRGNQTLSEKTQTLIEKIQTLIEKTQSNRRNSISALDTCHTVTITHPWTKQPCCLRTGRQRDSRTETARDRNIPWAKQPGAYPQGDKEIHEQKQPKTETFLGLSNLVDYSQGDKEIHKQKQP